KILNNHIPLSLFLCPKLLPRKALEPFLFLSLSVSSSLSLSLFNGGGGACKIDQVILLALLLEQTINVFTFCLVFYNVTSLKIPESVVVVMLLLGFCLSLCWVCKRMS
ncbi:hypothetical protein VIGAN_09219900, partial [Vigna angularis var. angularis]